MLTGAEADTQNAEGKSPENPVNFAVQATITELAKKSRHSTNPAEPSPA